MRSILTLAIPCAMACSGSSGGSSAADGGGGSSTIAEGLSYEKNGNPQDMVNPYARYETSEEVTELGAHDSDSSYPHARDLTIRFGAAGTGHFQCGPGTKTYIGDIEQSVTCTPTICPTATNWSAGEDDTCMIEVTQYGEVGARIVGTFTGTLSGSAGKLEVKGSFNLERGADQ